MAPLLRRVHHESNTKVKSASFRPTEPSGSAHHWSGSKAKTSTAVCLLEAHVADWLMSVNG